MKTKQLGYFKGIKTISKERNQWFGCDLNGIPWKMTCQSKEPGDRSMCFARHILDSRSDFVTQKFALQQEVENAKHILESYPKYHCKYNWGSAKREAHLRSNYTFKSLENNVSDYLDKAGNIVYVRRFFQRSMNPIEACIKYSDGREVLLEVKKNFNKSYLYHRRIRLEASLLTQKYNK